MPYKEALHKEKLFNILKDIYSHVTLAPLLGFKGGTAAYLHYGLTRGSLDLDFDLLNPDKIEEVRATLRLLLPQHGTIKTDDLTRHGAYFVLAYVLVDDNSPNIKIDINLRPFGSTFAPSTYQGVTMPVMVKPDMAANKIVVMYERMGSANRDIYDVWFFLKNGWEVNAELVERRAKTPYKEYLQKCVGKLDKIPSNRILSGLGELLPEKTKVWVKQHLVAETIELLRARIAREDAK